MSYIQIKSEKQNYRKEGIGSQEESRSIDPIFAVHLPIVNLASASNIKIASQNVNIIVLIFEFGEGHL